MAAKKKKVCRQRFAIGLVAAYRKQAKSIRLDLFEIQSRLDDALNKLRHLVGE